MAVHILQPDALDLLAEFETTIQTNEVLREGTIMRFKESQLIVTAYSFAGAKQRYQQFQEEVKELTPEDNVFPLAMIYGWGGWNRYRVGMNGEIQISLHHIPPIGQDKFKSKGKELGFDFF